MTLATAALISAVFVIDPLKPLSIVKAIFTLVLAPGARLAMGVL